MATVWVVTSEYNAYDQHGDYFVAVFMKKPSFHELKAILPAETDVTIGKLSRGGGRQGWEDKWFYLVEAECGKLYPE